jgi:2-methylthioadenine synthetase
MLHTKQQVLITGTSKRDPNMLSGRTENNRVINLIGPTTLIGKILDVLVTGVKANTLVGELPV